MVLRSSSGHFLSHGGRESFVEYELTMTSGPIVLRTPKPGPYIQYLTRFSPTALPVPPIPTLKTSTTLPPTRLLIRSSRRFGQAQSLCWLRPLRHSRPIVTDPPKTAIRSGGLVSGSDIRRSTIPITRSRTSRRKVGMCRTALRRRCAGSLSSRSARRVSFRNASRTSSSPAATTSGAISLGSGTYGLADARRISGRCFLHSVVALAGDTPEGKTEQTSEGSNPASTSAIASALASISSSFSSSGADPLPSSSGSAAPAAAAAAATAAVTFRTASSASRRSSTLFRSAFRSSARRSSSSRRPTPKP
mmetsp:Transcript_14965/g.34705  ORF Transcript_14965/g.34705 Transcript_14965/m.34705 type:complete len:306 (-) Transcript_14965:315-1232(-)